MSNWKLFKLPRPEGAGIADALVMDVATRNKLRVWVTERTRTKNVQPSQADVLGSVYVGTSRMTASLAQKLIASLAIGFLGMSALIAPLAGEARINSDQRYASALRLVIEERPQLCEAPSVQCSLLALPCLYPSAYAVEIFDGNSASGAFSEADYLFGNLVVGVRDKARLFAAALLQQSLGRLRADALHLPTQRLIAMPDLVQLTPAEFVAVAVGV